MHVEWNVVSRRKSQHLAEDAAYSRRQAEAPGVHSVSTLKDKTMVRTRLCYSACCHTGEFFEGRRDLAVIAVPKSILPVVAESEAAPIPLPERRCQLPIGQQIRKSLELPVSALQHGFTHGLSAWKFRRIMVEAHDLRQAP